MIDLADRSTPRLMLDLLLEALRIKSDRINAIASELIVREGVQPVRRLVLEACHRKNSVAHRLRVLGVIARICTFPDAADFLDLSCLLGDRNERIRAAAAAILAMMPQRSG